MAVALVFCGTYLIPVLISFLLYRFKVVGSLLMVEAKDRRLPYAFSALSFYFTATLLGQIDGMRDAYLFLIGSTLVIILHLFTLSIFKPSAHMAGIGGFLALLMALSLKYGLNFLLYIFLALFLSGLLASARLALHAHTRSEVIFGWLSGWVLIFICVYFY